jgi:hypothetical protein
MHPGVAVGEVARCNTTSAESGRYVREGKSVQAGVFVMSPRQHKATAAQFHAWRTPRLPGALTPHFASIFTATWHVFKRGMAGLWLRLMSSLCLSGSLTACALRYVPIPTACPGIDTPQTSRTRSAVQLSKRSTRYMQFSQALGLGGAFPGLN